MAGVDVHGPLPAFAAHAARELRAGEALADTPTAEALAGRLDVSPRMLARLLAVLSLKRLVRPLPDGRFALGDGAWPAGPCPPAASLIVEVLRRGRPLSEAEIESRPEARMLGLLADHGALPAKAGAAAELLAPRFRTRPGWFIDVGCGVGQHSRALLDRAPLAAATLVDAYPPAIAQATWALQGYGGRVDIVAGDFLAVDLGPSRYRAALLCDVLHVLSRDACRRFLQRIASILEPGGSLLIGEMAPGARATIFALSASLLLGAFDAYGPDDIAGFCREAGFAGLSTRPCPGVEDALFYLAGGEA